MQRWRLNLSDDITIGERVEGSDEGVSAGGDKRGGAGVAEEGVSWAVAAVGVVGGESGGKRPPWGGDVARVTPRGRREQAMATTAAMDMGGGDEKKGRHGWRRLTTVVGGC